MLPVQYIQIIKYTFDVPVVAMVSHIPAKSRMGVNYVTGGQRGTLGDCRLKVCQPFNNSVCQVKVGACVRDNKRSLLFYFNRSGEWTLIELNPSQYHMMARSGKSHSQHDRS